VKHERRLQELAGQHAVDARGTAALCALLALLARDPAAPSTVTAPADAVDAHVADSLAALVLPCVRGATRVADLGSGAGFPGLVLAAALPGARVALVESSSRKCAFLERAVVATGLDNAEVVCARAEEWREGLGACDLVCARAVAPLPVLAEYAAPLLTHGGALVAWKGRRDPAEDADGAAAASATGLGTPHVRRVEPFPEADHRHLHLYLKVGSTPNRYPRRAGMARKRPLSASS
jgi:16S rRNA (guanine527-N7)-methyltransferase